MFTIKRATANEVKVQKLLKRVNLEAKLCENEYAYYDLFAQKENKGYLFEVKERRQIWPELVIEEIKVKRCMDIADRCTLATIPYLVCSIMDVHYFYLMTDIVKNGKLAPLHCNKATAKGFYGEGEKVEKLMYYFDKDSYEFILK